MTEQQRCQQAATAPACLEMPAFDVARPERQPDAPEGR